ncbi:MAG: MATE family efflux transporter [Oscillospiraceae bacterium]|nr:MATE family efflux transporter [Oscillospiraceae bacterium]
MSFHLRAGAAVKEKKLLDLTQGSIAGGILQFAWPVFLGQLLQQFYNMADAWVIGNFADNDSFAAVSSGGNLTFLIIGLFGGIAMGGGVVISRYFGAKDNENITKAIHNNFLFGILASVIATLLGLFLVPQMLVWMKTPSTVLPQSLAYFRVYFGGICTVILYNNCMAILRALGDSMRPLYYLLISSLINVALDLLFVAGFRWGVTGAAAATVIAQGISVALCLVRMFRIKDDVTRFDLHKLRFDKHIMAQILRQGLPSGIQNSVISLGNVVVQTNINSFGAFAMAGHGAQAKLEGFGFLPITAMSMSLPTFISQNVGAGKIDRAKKGAAFGIGFGVLLAELMGIAMYAFAPQLLRIFVDEPMSVEFGTVHLRTTALFFFLLAFSHCAAGTLRGLGRSTVPMVTMLSFWCGVRIVYVTVALQFFPVFRTISWAYPITWCLSTVVYLIYLLRMDWSRGRL